MLILAERSFPRPSDKTLSLLSSLVYFCQPKWCSLNVLCISCVCFRLLFDDAIFRSLLTCTCWYHQETSSSPQLPFQSHKIQTLGEGPPARETFASRTHSWDFSLRALLGALPGCGCLGDVASFVSLSSSERSV